MAGKLQDLNRNRKTYPLLRVKPVYEEIGGTSAEVAILIYNNSFEESYTFQNTYQQIPSVSATPEDENVNVFITTLTTTSVTVQSSSAFTGKVHIQIFEPDN